MIDNCLNNIVCEMKQEKKESHAAPIFFNIRCLKRLQGMVITCKERKHYLSGFYSFFSFLYLIDSAFITQTCDECQEVDPGVRK